MVRHMKAGFQGDLAAKLAEFFDGPATDTYVGYFQCQQLP